MNKIRKHIIGFSSISLSLIVLMTTSGFSIHLHHCNHSHTNTYSLFVPSDGCEKHLSKTVEKGCCAIKSENACTSSQKEESGKSCCTDHQKTVKLYTPSVLNHSVPVIKIHEMEWFPSLYSVGVEYFAYLTPKEGIYCLDNKPPPYSVHDFLARIQVFLI